MLNALLNRVWSERHKTFRLGDQTTRVWTYSPWKGYDRKQYTKGDSMTDRQFIERLLDIMEHNALADWITNDPYDEFEALRVMIKEHLKRT